jgi:beta-galactosidase/beta-glucuronidase
MGTLLWQLNDCWPVTSWSITDYSRQPKAAWYAVKQAYKDEYFESKFDGNFLNLELHSSEPATFKIASYRFYSPDNKLIFELADTLDSEKHLKARHLYSISNFTIDTAEFQKKYSVSFSNILIKASYLNRRMPLLDWSNSFSYSYPKFQKLQKPEFTIMPHENFLQIWSQSFARFVCLEMDGVKFSDNYFDLPPNTIKIIRFSSKFSNEEVYKNFQIKSLYDILSK